MTTQVTVESSVLVRRDEIDALASEVRGPVLVPGQDGYSAECRVYNANISLSPALGGGSRSPLPGARTQQIAR